MTNSMNVASIISQPQQPQRKRQNNVYQMPSSNDQFVRQQPVVVQQPAMSQDDMFVQMLQEQQKEEKKQKLKQNLSWGIGIASGLAIIAMVGMQLKSMKNAGIDSIAKDMKKSVEKAKYDIIRNVDNEKTLDELVLPDELKKVTNDIKILFDRNEQLKKKGMRGNSAIMLYGEPGGGKNAYTYGLTKYVQSRYPGSELIMMDVLKFNSKWLGETENNILGFSEGIIKRAKDIPDKKIVVFMDEFDSISRKATGNGAENSEKFQNAFKTAFNKLLEVDNIQIIAATNRASKDAPLNQLLDEAILNRFAKKVHIPLPTKEQFTNAIVTHYNTLPKEVIKPEMVDLNNKTLEKIVAYVTKPEHHASFRDMNYILDRARIISESEATSRPIEMKDLIQATKEHADSMNWKDVLNI